MRWQCDLAGELIRRASGRLSSHSRRSRASCWVTRNSAARRSAACQAAVASCCARSAASAACFARSANILGHKSRLHDKYYRYIRALSEFSHFQYGYKKVFLVSAPINVCVRDPGYLHTPPHSLGPNWYVYI